MTPTPNLFAHSQSFWLAHREATLNWLAVGVLLAAWNAADRGESAAESPRPEALRAYASVSPRAAQRAGIALRGVATSGAARMR